MKELPLLGIGVWLLHDVLSGGGIARVEAASAGHPTRAVFIVPLVLVAAVGGLAARALRLGLRAWAGKAASMPTYAFLMVRRLAAGRALLTVLLVVSAVSFGAYFYAQALSASVSRSVDEKAYIAYGGDAQGVVAEATPLPRRFPLPVTTVDDASQVATVGSADGAAADVLAVDPATLRKVIRWYRDWGPDPRPLLTALTDPSPRALPAIVTRNAPANTSAIWLQGIRVPVHIVSRVAAFPGMSAGIPLVIVARTALEKAAAKAHVPDALGFAQTYVWAKGPPTQAAKAIEAQPFQASYITTVNDFRKDPDVVLATRTFAYMRLIAITAGTLVLVGLLLYLQARQRSQALASALTARMGLRRRTETLSLSLELAAIATIAAVVGGATALLTARPIVRHVDPLTNYPPAPSPALPVAALLWALLGLTGIALIGGAATSWRARHADPSESIRLD